MTGKLSKLKDYPLLVIFAAFLLGFMVWDILEPNKVFSEFENRYLAQKPTFTVRSLMENTYTKRFELYLNEQFVLRDEWIALKSMGESALQKTENNDIVYGKDDYMFEKYKAVPQAQLDRNFGYVKDFVQQNPELSIAFGVIPNSYMINPERVPYGLGNVDQREVIDGLYGKLEGVGNVKTLDLFGPLEAEKGAYLYYRTDHHWTTYGAYLAYSHYVEEMGRTPGRLELLSEHQVEDFAGTYFNKAKPYRAVLDTITWYDIPMESVTIDGEAKESYLDLAQFEARDKYAAFLWGNYGYTVLKNETENPESTKVMVIKDSYGNCFSPFLLMNYDEVHIVDFRALGGGITEILEDNEFDDVLILYNFMNFASDTNVFKLVY